MFGFFRCRKAKLEAAKAAANQQSIDYGNRLSQQRTVYVQDNNILTSPEYAWYPNNIHHVDRAASSNPYTPIQALQGTIIDNVPTPACDPAPTQSYDSSDKCGSATSYDSSSSSSSYDSGSSSSDSSSSSSPDSGSN